MAVTFDFRHTYADSGQPDRSQNNGIHDRARGSRYDTGKFYHCTVDGGRIVLFIPDTHPVPVFVQLLFTQGCVAACA